MREHGIRGLVTDAGKALLRHRPKNHIAFLFGYFIKRFPKLAAKGFGHHEAIHAVHHYLPNELHAEDAAAASAGAGGDHNSAHLRSEAGAHKSYDQ